MEPPCKPPRGRSAQRPCLRSRSARRMLTSWGSSYFGFGFRGCSVVRQVRSGDLALVRRKQDRHSRCQWPSEHQPVRVGGVVARALPQCRIACPAGGTGFAECSTRETSFGLVCGRMCRWSVPKKIPSSKCASGGLLICCSDYRCSYSAVSQLLNTSDSAS